MRIASVARDAAFQRMLGGPEFAAQVVRGRPGDAFDPAVAIPLADAAEELLARRRLRPSGRGCSPREPGPRSGPRGRGDRSALAAMGDFADLASPYLVGHSAGVAELAGGGRRCRLEAVDLVAGPAGALVHDLGRVAVPLRIWQKAGPLTPDEWERVRLHAYHSERVLATLPLLAALAPVASAHHERLDGSGYHRGAAAAELGAAGAPARRRRRLLRDDRAAAAPGGAARPGRRPRPLGREAGAGRLDLAAVAAVLEAAGQRVPRIERPAGLTDREAEVIALLARGCRPSRSRGRSGSR